MVDSGLGTVYELRSRGTNGMGEDSQHGVVLDLGFSEGRTVSGDQDEFG